MTRNLETELNEAFSALAAEIPPDAGRRLRAIDYRPRTFHLSPRLTVGTLGGVAAVAGTVVSVAVLGGAQPAFAGWSAAPTLPSSTQSAAAQSACQAQLAATAGLSGSPTAVGWNPVITDVRGPFSVVIYQDGGANATCFTGPTFTVVSRSSGSRNVGGEAFMSSSRTESGELGAASSGSTMVNGSESSDIPHMSVTHLDSSIDGPYTLVEGQIVSGVTNVTLVRSDGSDVQASSGNGWFVAWWPGSQDVTSAQITTPSGVSSQSLQATSPAPTVGIGAGAGATTPPSTTTTTPTTPSTSTSTGGGTDTPTTNVQDG
jgi:hypothetical protein